MTIPTRQMIVIEERDIRKAFFEKYGRNINVAQLLFGDGYINDCYLPISLVDAYKDAVWDYKIAHNLTHTYSEDNNDEWEDEWDMGEIDFDTMKECKEKDIIRICNMLWDINDTILIEISW